MAAGHALRHEAGETKHAKARRRFDHQRQARRQRGNGRQIAPAQPGGAGQRHGEQQHGLHQQQLAIGGPEQGRGPADLETGHGNACYDGDGHQSQCEGRERADRFPQLIGAPGKQRLYRQVHQAAEPQQGTGRMRAMQR